MAKAKKSKFEEMLGVEKLYIHVTSRDEYDQLMGVLKKHDYQWASGRDIIERDRYHLEGQQTIVVVPTHLISVKSGRLSTHESRGNKITKWSDIDKGDAPKPHSVIVWDEKSGDPAHVCYSVKEIRVKVKELHEDDNVIHDSIRIYKVSGVRKVTTHYRLSKI